MQIGRIIGANRTLGKSQGYYGLPVRDDVEGLGDLPQLLHTVGFNAVDGNCPVMFTVWHPTPDELARLNAGAGVQVQLVGVMHPPIMVSVGDIPE